MISDITSSDVARDIVGGVARDVVRSAIGAREISGFAYPGETLSMPSGGSSYQWFVNSDNRGTAQTLTLTVDDIGKTVTGIRNGVVLPTKTVWHPNTIAGVARVWVARSNAYTSISPNVLATNGQGVRRWEGIIASTQADQATGGLQPTYQSSGVGGQPSLLLDGSDDFFDLATPTDVLRNKSQAYIIVGVKDTNPTGGSSSHIAIGYNGGAGVGDRLTVATRFAAGNNFAAFGRRLNTDSPTAVTTPSSGNYTVVRGHGDYSNGFVRLAVNGTVLTSASLPSGSGQTSDVASTIGRIGATATVLTPGSYLQGHICGIAVVNAAISATDLSRLERYIALLGGTEAPNIALV